MIETIANPWLWTGFFALVIAMLAADLFLLGGRTAHKVSLREAGAWTIVWIGVALAFAGGLWFYLDAQHGRELADAKATEFLTGYVIEKALAVDNVFVWLMLFGYFAIPAEYQRRVLLYGVLGAIVMRTIMVFAGAALIARFHWILYVFGAFLLFTGVKMLLSSDQAPDLDNNAALKWLRRHLRLTPTLHGERFLLRRDGLLYATPLMLALILVEISDLIFAVDSVPAIFAITTDPFIVLTSNILAILGLRAMYFLLADVADRFSMLKYGLSLVLVFIGTKMLIMEWIKIPVGIALSVVAALIVGSMLLSLLRKPAAAGTAPRPER